MNNISFGYTKATILAIVTAVIAVAVSFGLHLTQNNIDSVLTLVGIICTAISIGGGAKSAGLIHAGVPVNVNWHLTPAIVVSAIGAVIALAVSFGLHMTQANIDSIMKLVGLVAGGIIVGGGVKSAAMLRQGIHPALKAGKAAVARGGD